LAVTTMFANDPLIAGDVLDDLHILQLRSAVDALRSLANLSAAVYTGNPPSLFAVSMNSHVTELRARLDEARIALLLGSFSYSDTPLPADAVIKAVHVNELRGGVK
jgi:hypothetical protein